MNPHATNIQIERTNKFYGFATAFIPCCCQSSSVTIFQLEKLKHAKIMESLYGIESVLR